MGQYETNDSFSFGKTPEIPDNLEMANWNQSGNIIRAIIISISLVFSPTGTLFISENAAASSKKGDIEKDEKECKEAEEKAQKQCSDKGNQNAQQAQQTGNQNAQNQGGSGQQNCSNTLDAFKAMEPLMKAFQGECAGAQEECKKKCEKAKGSGAKNCPGANAGPSDQSECQGEGGKAKGTGEEKEGKCKGLDVNLAAIAAALANLALQMAQQKQCQKATNLDCADPKNSLDPKCKKPFDCNLPEYATDQKCVCARNPRGQGCSEFGGTDNPEALGKIPPKNTGGAGVPIKTANSTSGVGSEFGGGGAKSGGGAGGGSGGGGGGGPKGGDKSKAQDGKDGKPTVPVITAGDYGGGGPGGKVGGGYPDSDIRKPGSAKPGTRADQRRLLAKDGFTGSMGRTNWEKVRDRYRANHPTLFSR